MHHILGLLVLALVAIVVGMQALKLRTRLSLNKAVYLMNQQQWNQAEQQLERVRKIDVSNEEALRQYALVLVAQKRYDEALAVLGKATADAETAFARGVCEFQTGNERAAKASFAYAAGTTHNKLPAQLRILATVAASGFEEQMDIEQMQTDPPEHPAYIVLVSSFGGRALFNGGNFAAAGVLLEQALLLGDKNPVTRSYAVAAFAAAGNFSQAEYAADYGTVPLTLREARSVAVKRQDDLPARSVSLEAASDAAETSANLQRALLWTEKQSLPTTATEELQSLASGTLALMHARKYDLHAALLYGEVLEKLGHDREAFKHYANMLQLEPTYIAKLRANNLTGKKRPVTPVEFVSPDAYVAYIEASTMAVTNSMLQNGHVAFFSRSSAMATVEVPDEGTYRLNIVARGDRAFGLWPVCTIHVDGEPADRIYVNRDSWDCYSIVAKLRAGRRQIRLEYTNNSDRLLSQDEDRNLYVAGVLVSKGAQ